MLQVLPTNAGSSRRAISHSRHECDTWHAQVLVARSHAPLPTISAHPRWLLRYVWCTRVSNAKYGVVCTWEHHDHTIKQNGDVTKGNRAEGTHRRHASTGLAHAFRTFSTHVGGMSCWLELLMRTLHGLLSCERGLGQVRRRTGERPLAVAILCGDNESTRCIWPSCWC